MKKPKHIPTLEFLKSIVNKEFRFSYQSNTSKQIFRIVAEGNDHFWMEVRDGDVDIITRIGITIPVRHEWQYHASMEVGRKGIKAYKSFCGEIVEKNITRKNFVLTT